MKRENQSKSKSLRVSVQKVRMLSGESMKTVVGGAIVCGGGSNIPCYHSNTLA